MISVSITILSVIFLVALCTPSRAVAADLILCEQASRRILIISDTVDWNDASNITWEWSARTAPEIRPEHASYWFDYFGDAKAVKGRTHLLITGSGGAGGGVGNYSPTHGSRVWNTTAQRGPDIPAVTI